MLSQTFILLLLLLLLVPKTTTTNGSPRPERARYQRVSRSPSTSSSTLPRPQTPPPDSLLLTLRFRSAPSFVENERVQGDAARCIPQERVQQRKGEVSVDGTPPRISTDMLCLAVAGASAAMSIGGECVLPVRWPSPQRRMSYRTRKCLC